MDVLQHQDYRDILQAELARRMKQNPRYSQGAFARDLAVTPSRLSEILHGKQGVSSTVAENMARLLRLNEEESRYFLDLVESQHGRSRLLREAARLRLTRFRRSPMAEVLGADTFHLIEDWYNLAVLELLALEEEEQSVAILAQRLRIQEQQAQEALDRLERLGLIARNGGDRWLVLDRDDQGISTIQSHSFQMFCQQILLKSLEALQEQRPHAMHSYMIPVSRQELPTLITLLKEALNGLVEQLDQAQIGKKDSVYCLTSQFFPVTHALENGSSIPDTYS